MGHPELFDEAGRLAALARYDILDTGPEQPLEKLVTLVQALLGVPMAGITFLDDSRQWFKARRGLTICETERKDAFCNYTILSPKPMIVTDASQDQRFRENPYVLGDPKITSYLGVPLITPDGFALGALCAMDTVPRTFQPTQIELMTDLAGLTRDWLEMRRIAETDFLTGAMTRRALVAEIAREMARCRRHGRASALAMLDIDHFKAINDTYGHPFGDEVIKAVAGICTARLRAGDRLGRLGGEEFALLLPETSPEEALHAIERLRQAIADLRFELQPDVRVTASFGIAALPCGGSDDPERWLAFADAELYRAKTTGRNRVVLREAAADD